MARKGAGRGPEAERAGVVLVVDDDDAIRFLISEVVGDLAVVREAASTDQAMRVLVGREPLLGIILDVRLGANGRAGLDLLVAIRARHTEVPVMMITGLDAAEVGARAHLLGATVFLPKPVPTENIRRFVEDAIARARARAMRPDARVLHAHLESVARQCRLTARERRVLPFVALGVPRGTIALTLSRSVWTIRAQIASIRGKERRSASGQITKLGRLFGTNLLEVLALAAAGPKRPGAG